MRFRISVDGLPFHVFHDEVGKPVAGAAAIEEPRNVRMIEAGQDLSFVSEVSQHGVSIHSALDYLYRNALLELRVSALRQIDCAHTATAYLANHAIRANAFAAGKRGARL